MGQSIRYISNPSPADIQEVKTWMLTYVDSFEDEFDMSVECAHDLGIFDLDARLMNLKADRDIPEWIVKLSEKCFYNSFRK